MKKIFFTSVLMMALFVGAFAQSSNNMYKMNSAQDADLVLKVLMTDLHLDLSAQTPIRGLLEKSALSQQEQLSRMQNKNDLKMMDMIIARQTAHIETNLKNMIGDAKYQQYEKIKDKIAADIQKMKN